MFYCLKIFVIIVFSGITGFYSLIPVLMMMMMTLNLGYLFYPETPVLEIGNRL